MVAATLLASPVTHAQRSQKMWRAGFLSLDTAASIAGQQTLQLFPAALAKLGYREGTNLLMEWRWADGKSAALSELAAGLVRVPVDIIVARTNAPIVAARNATVSIPIVMLNGNFPVETGLVESLAHPGGNVTGTSYISTETFGKQMQVLQEVVPSARRVAVLLVTGGDAYSYSRMIRDSLDQAAVTLGMTVQFFDVRGPEEIVDVLERIASSRVDAVFYAGSPILRTRTSQIMDFLRRRKLPSIATIPTFAEAGGLVHYAPDTHEFYDRTASYVARILAGAKPADLPIQQPTKFELVINLKTAKAVGITIPPAVLVRADKVIQ
jgi:putative tryptophan/tyrosine transport system substrate-binding protein